MAKCNMCKESIKWVKFKMGWKAMNIDGDEFHDCSVVKRLREFSSTPNTTKWNNWRKNQTKS